MELGIEQVGEFVKIATSGGVVRIWETKRACGVLAKKMNSDVLEAAYDADVKVMDQKTATERAFSRGDAALAAQAFAEGKVPLWRLVTGLAVNVNAREMHPAERFQRTARLVKAVERVVRSEWRAFEKLGKQHAEVGAEGCLEDVRDGDVRVRWWDPLRFVAEQFGLAYSAISRFAREAAGLSASDLTDRIKAERVRTRMRERVKQWVLEIYSENEELKELSGAELANGLWRAVQAKRGRGKWSRSSWAVEYGYSSYTRFHRACLGFEGLTPVELERAVMDEVLDESTKSEIESPKSGACGADVERGEVRGTKDEVRGDTGESRGTLESERGAGR